jgi:hypothetical protein
VGARGKRADQERLGIASRQDSRLVNQNDLFAENVVPLNEVVGRVPELYAWLGA